MLINSWPRAWFVLLNMKNPLHNFRLANEYKYVCLSLRLSFNENSQGFGPSFRLRCICNWDPWDTGVRGWGWECDTAAAARA